MGIDILRRILGVLVFSGKVLVFLKKLSLTVSTGGSFGPVGVWHGRFRDNPDAVLLSFVELVKPWSFPIQTHFL